MWPPSDLFYVVCPRNSKFMDYFPAMLCGDLAKERLRIDPEGKTTQSPPRIEVTGLTCRPIASANSSRGATEETIASVTLKDPESGLVIGTAICIGLTSSSVAAGPSRGKAPAPTPRRPWQRPAASVASAKVSAGYAGKRAVSWAGGSRFHPSGRDHPHMTASAPRSWS